MKINRIKELVKLVELSNINELEVNFGEDKSIRIVKNVSVTTVASAASAPFAFNNQPPVQTSPSDAATAEDKTKEKEYYEIVAPIVGTLYRKPSPDEPPYVKQGDHVQKGDVVCLLEAMKIFNDIKSPVSGTIVKVMVEDGVPVEYGHVLFLVDTD